MKTLAAAAALAATLALALPAGAQQEPVTVTGYPAPNSSFSGRVIVTTLCPTAWVEMTKTGVDNVHSSAWHCVEFDHTCVTTAGGGRGCSGGKLQGWELAAAPAALDLRAEIEREVIDRCFMEVAKRKGVAEHMRGVVVAATKRQTAKQVENMIAQVQGAADDAGLRSAGDRQALYDLFRATCIASATKG